MLTHIDGGSNLLYENLFVAAMLHHVVVLLYSRELFLWPGLIVIR